MKMNKKTAILALSLTAAMSFSIGIRASTGSVIKELYYRNIKVTLNGQQITLFDSSGYPCEPFIIDGTAYLPLRGIATAMGADVQWDGAANTIIINTKTQKVGQNISQMTTAPANSVGFGWFGTDGDTAARSRAAYGEVTQPFTTPSQTSQTPSAAAQPAATPSQSSQAQTAQDKQQTPTVAAASKGTYPASETVDISSSKRGDTELYKITNAHFHHFKNSIGSNEYRAFVEVTNTSDTNLYLKGAVFDIEDNSGHLLQTEDWLSCCPDIIAPGEKGYFYVTVQLGGMLSN